MTSREMADALLRELSDRGQIVEGGWRAYEILTLKDASEIQRSECRKAYFFGAEHVFMSMMGMLDSGPGTEPTELELERMDKLHAEITRFVDEIKATGGIGK